MKPSPVFGMVLCCVGIQSVAVAQMTLIETERSLFLEITTDAAITASQQSLDPGPFALDLADSDCFVFDCIEGMVGQSTTITETLISGTGYGEIVTEGFSNGSAISRLDVAFFVPSPTPYRLSGTIDGFNSLGDPTSPTMEFPTDASVLLESDGDVLHAVTQTVAGMPVAFDLSGVLPAGNYRLLAIADVHDEIFSSGESSFTIAFSVPEPRGGLWVFLLPTCLMLRTCRNRTT